VRSSTRESSDELTDGVCGGVEDEDKAAVEEGVEVDAGGFELRWLRSARSGRSFGFCGGAADEGDGMAGAAAS
jgi:hypothetical protein